MKRLAMILGVCVGLAGCGTRSDTPGDAASGGAGKLRAVATTGMVADLVRQIGGDHVEVSQLMGAGVDPHLYVATRDDVSAILQADIVFYSGLMLEGKLADTLVKVGRKKPVYAVTEEIDHTLLLEPEDQPGHHDPHLWMDVEAWSRCIDVVEKVLNEKLPAYKEEFAANAAKYRQTLASLHEYGRKTIATVPPERRVLITSHDAFNYFGRAYDLEVIGVQGLSTESEAGLQRINELVELITNRKISAVFVESSVSPKNIEALIDGANSRGHKVVIGGELYSDAMGAGGTYEGTYVGMLDHNITIVVRALGGTAPERGMQEKLSIDGESQ